MKARIHQTDDLELILELDRACFPHDTVLKGDEFDHSVWWVAELDGKPVAYAGLHPLPVGGVVVQRFCEHDREPFLAQGYEKAFLCRAGVLSEARGQGLQVRLIRARVAHAKRLGIPRVYTYVATQNVASMRSLIKCGFLPYHYSRDEQIACIYMDKKLTGGTK